MVLALKEWAYVVDALGKGKQNILIRKGGIAEDQGEFSIQSNKFLLLPTQFHQSTDLLKPDWKSSLNGDRFRIDEFTTKVEFSAQIVDSKIVKDWNVLKKLDEYHCLSEEVIKERFERWEKQVHLLIVQIFKLNQPIDLLLRPEYSGCKSWININENIDLSGTPIINPSIK